MYRCKSTVATTIEITTIEIINSLVVQNTFLKTNNIYIVKRVDKKHSNMFNK